MENLSSASINWIKRTRSGLLIFVLVSSCFCCFGQLPTDLVLPSETLDSGTIVYQASNSITNSADFLVQAPASVTLTSGSYIHLEPGFTVTGGSAFHAVIDPNVVQWQPIPVPAPPTPCTSCGLNYADGSSGTNPQAVYAPSSSIKLYAYCTDAQRQYVVPCNIGMSNTAYLYTNGHFHSYLLPHFSSINPTSGYTGNYANYSMPVMLTTTQVGQIETITVVNQNSGYVTNYDYGVGYSGLVYIDNSDIFYQTGGNTTNHGDNTWNHYMTVNAATGLQQAATAYINKYNPGQKVCINDMALPIGGKFDINDDWQSPHISHDEGTAADVAATAGQCPANYTVNSNHFIQECINAGALAQNTINEGNHVHCRWAY